MVVDIAHMLLFTCFCKFKVVQVETSIWMILVHSNNILKSINSTLQLLGQDCEMRKAKTGIRVLRVEILGFVYKFLSLFKVICCFS